MLLGGAVDPPPWAGGLLRTLENCTGMPGTRDWINDDFNRSPDSVYAFASPSPRASPSPVPSSRKTSFLSRKKDKQAFPPAHWEVEGNGDSYSPAATIQRYDSDRTPASEFDSRFPPRNPAISHRTGNSLVTDLDNPFGNADAITSTSAPRGHVPHAASLGGNFKYSYSNELSHPASRSVSQSKYNTSKDYANLSNSPFSDSQRRMSQHSYIKPKPELMQPLGPGQGLVHAIALFDFKAVEVYFVHIRFILENSVAIS
jgi:hypothetical protein